MNAQDLKKSDYSILIVDDDAGVCDILSESLLELGYKIESYLNPLQCIDRAKAFPQSILFVLADFQMKEMSGLDLRKNLKTLVPSASFALMSGVIHVQDVQSALNEDVCGFFEKPLPFSAISELVSKEVQKRFEAVYEKKILSKSFLEEAAELLSDLEPLLLNLEVDADAAESIKRIFRLIHTLKGSSGVLDLPEFTHYIHVFEDLLVKAKEGKIQVGSKLCTVLLNGYDSISSYCEILRKGASSSEFDFPTLEKNLDLSGLESGPQLPSKEGKKPGQQDPEKEKTVRVPNDLLDEFLGLSGETTVIRNMVNKLLLGIHRKLPVDKDLSLLTELLEETHKIVSSMQLKIMDMRKVSAGDALKKLPRSVRDLALDLKKEVKLEMTGTDLRIDHSIANVLSTALIHVVRNSVDHGIELPDERLRKGKKREGQIIISVAEKNDSIIISLKDDGAGINSKRIKDKLIKNGSDPIVVATMPDSAIFNTIFESGFSTAQTVTNVSGRGVGMDMVKSSVEGLKGSIQVDSQLGLGTTFDITIPIPKSVTIMSALTVKIADRGFSIPQSQVLRLYRAESSEQRSQILSFEGMDMLSYEGKLLPLLDLKSKLGLNAEQAVYFSSRDVINIVLVSASKRIYGLVVDEICDVEDIVLKPLHPALASQGLFKGATFMGDGSVGLVVDVDRIESHIQDSSQPSRTEQVQQNAPSTANQREYLSFELADHGVYAVDLRKVFRIEEVEYSQIKTSAEEHVLFYRDAIIPVISLNKYLGPVKEEPNQDGKSTLVVISSQSGYQALVVKKIINTLQAPIDSHQLLSQSHFLESRFEHHRDIVNVLSLDKVISQDLAQPTNKTDTSKVIQMPLRDLPETKEPEVNLAAGWGVF